MPFAFNGDVKLYYERLGPSSARSVLLINGAGRQCIDFTDEFCDLIAKRGFQVIRYDQRDTGLSSAFSTATPNAAGVAEALAAGRTPALPYGIRDLAADALAVLDTNKIDRCHLFGRSLGSAVAQVMALDHPNRVLSMTLAIALSRGIGQNIAIERLRRLDAEHFETEASYLDRQEEVARAVGNAAYFDRDRIRTEAAHAFRRGIHRGAISRHFMVGLAIPNLLAQLSSLDLPVQVIHGRLDRVVPLEFGEETAAAIARAKLLVPEDMAHEAPPQLWRRWIDAFVSNAETRG